MRRDGEAARGAGDGAVAGAGSSGSRDGASDGQPSAAGAPVFGKVQVIKAGFMMLDTPQWLVKDNALIFPDIRANPTQLYKLVPPSTITAVRQNVARCGGAADGTYYCNISGLTRFAPGAAQGELLVGQFADGTPISANDMVISSKGIIYFSTLQDAGTPMGLGRFSVFRIADKSLTTAFDAATHPELQNPNGVAISPDEKFLYVGIAYYAARATKSGIYRFPIQGDGSLDVAAGSTKMWSETRMPDGLAVDSVGNVYATTGASITVLAQDAKRITSLALPGNATNLAFGGPDLKTLYITLNTALAQASTTIPGTLP